jgi:hypothetical protein
MAILNSAAFPKHLDGDINKIFFDDFEQYARDYLEVAKIETAPPGGHYTEAELSGLGHLETKTEGNSITFDVPVEGNEKTIYYTTYAKGFQITEEGMADDLFGNFKKLPAKLSKSAAIRPDVVFFNHVFNNGFVSSTAWDGNFIFDTDHTQLYTGLANLANEPTTASDLSETSLQEAYEYYWGVEDEAGMPMYLDPEILLVAPQNTWMVNNLYKSSGMVGSANNDINTVNPSNGVISWRPFVSRFLTDTDAWFLLSKQRDCRLYWKKQATLESADDFYTGNALFKVTMRFGVGVFDWRTMYGNPGA